MATARVSKVRLAVVLALVSASATLGLAATVGRPAAADVTATSGRAFGASAELLGLQLIPETPVVAGSGIGYGPDTETTVALGLPLPDCPVVPGAISLINILSVCAITATTFGLDDPDPHLRSANSEVTIAGVSVGTGPDGLLTLSAIEATCRADGEEIEGTTTIADATLGPNPIVLSDIAPNTDLDVPGVLSVVLNEQIPDPDPDTVGTNTITVNAVHITLLDSTEIILGHVECTATGPNVNNVGDVEIVKVAPADAQDVDFDFAITCTGFGNAPTTRTFTGTVTGNGSTFGRTLQAGTMCTVEEEPTAGFDDQPPQTVTVVRDTIQTVTFTNTRTVGPGPGLAGSVQVVKVAPADAQDLDFNFTITCPGATGSPFTRTVTGSDTTPPVSNLAAGTVCTVSEETTAGFVDQADRTLPAVIAGAIQRVTFVNTRVGSAAPPGPQGPRGPAGPAGPRGPGVLARTGANTASLVTLAGFALFLGSLLTLSGRSPGMLPALARNVAESVRLRRSPTLSSVRSSLLRAVKRRNGV